MTSGSDILVSSVVAFGGCAGCVQFRFIGMVVCGGGGGRRLGCVGIVGLPKGWTLWRGQSVVFFRQSIRDAARARLKDISIDA